MTDIVERLKINQSAWTTDGKVRLEAADEIESRQRVKELEAITTHFKKALSNTQRRLELRGDELAALKQSQGEPVAWRWKFDYHDIWSHCPPENELQNFQPLYTSAPTIPEGWQVVPIEPTEEMKESAKQFSWWEQKSMDELVWRSMLAAAPKHEDL